MRGKVVMIHPPVLAAHYVPISDRSDQKTPSEVWAANKCSEVHGEQQPLEEISVHCSTTLTNRPRPGEKSFHFIVSAARSPDWLGYLVKTTKKITQKKKKTKARKKMKKNARGLYLS